MLKYLPLLTTVVGNVVSANVLPPKYQSAVTTASLVLLALQKSILAEKPASETR